MYSLVMGSIVSSQEEEEEDQRAESLPSTFKPTECGDLQRISLDDDHTSSPVHLSGEKASEDRDVLVRQQGDGMEEEDLSLQHQSPEVPAQSQPPPEADLRQSTASTPSLTDDGASKSLNKKLGIRLPETGIVLDRLPPITDQVDLPPKIPSSPLVRENPKVYPKGTYPPSVKKAREAKFVPYEPYKGAVTQFTNRSKIRSPPKHLNSPTEDNVPGIDEGAEDHGLNRQLVKNYRAMLDAKEAELARLKAAAQNSEKQLKIQTQVNDEIKKLLVASVGEDIEARVDFLTQDKARLAADLITYNTKISRDWEEKEQLTVESDIWRSKFLASTLILEEVSRTKVDAETRANQLQHAARFVLNERVEVMRALNSAQAVLDNMAVSFNPLHTKQDRARNLVDLSSHVAQSARQLRDRLVGDKGQAPEEKVAGPVLDTPAEEELRRILGTVHTTDSVIPEQASSSLAKGARTLLLKMEDKAQAPGKSGFENCSHCNGTVHNV